jgi:hypothetical protein
MPAHVIDLAAAVQDGDLGVEDLAAVAGGRARPDHLLAPVGA